MRRLFRRRARRHSTGDEPAHNGEPLPGETSSLAGEEDDEYESEPFVPVAQQQDDYGAMDDDDETEVAGIAPAGSRRRFRPRVRVPRLHVPRLRLRRPRLTLTIRPAMLLLALALIVAGVLGTLLKQDRLDTDLTSWWPLALVAGAGLWMLAALIQRRVAAFLGGAASAGVGLSALLDTQDIAQVQETLLGVVLVAVGVGIVMRGLLLRGQTVE